jgi:hypothetical protein
MIVKPKTAFLAAGPETIKVLPGPDWPDSVMIECEVVAPQSAAGRTVHVLMPQAQIPAILKAIRDTAIAARSKGEGVG